MPKAVVLVKKGYAYLAHADEGVNVAIIDLDILQRDRISGDEVRELLPSVEGVEAVEQALNQIAEEKDRVVTDGYYVWVLTGTLEEASPRFKTAAEGRENPVPGRGVVLCSTTNGTDYKVVME